MEVLNQEKINRLASEIGEENVPVLLQIFLGELSNYIENLQADPEDKTQYLKEISHALKSSAASFGAEVLCEYAIEIDTHAKTGQGFNQSDSKEKMIDLLKLTYQHYAQLVAQ